jgi:hypothetical protein
MAEIEFWIQIENHSWDVSPNNIDRISGEDIQTLTGGAAPVVKTLTSPVTGTVTTQNIVGGVGLVQIPRTDGTTRRTPPLTRSTGLLHDVRDQHSGCAIGGNMDTPALKDPSLSAVGLLDEVKAHSCKERARANLRSTIWRLRRTNQDVVTASRLVRRVRDIREDVTEFIGHANSLAGKSTARSPFRRLALGNPHEARFRDSFSHWKERLWPHSATQAPTRRLEYVTRFEGTHFLPVSGGAS